MSSQKLSPVDRKEAKQQILNHFKSKYQLTPSVDDIAQDICNELEVRHGTLLGDIRRVKKELILLKCKLEKKLPQYFSVGSDLDIEVNYYKKSQVSKDRVKDISKKNAPVKKEEQKQLAKLQVAETREDLNKIYKSLGIL